MAKSWRYIRDLDVDPATGPYGRTGLRVHNMTNAQQPTAATTNNGLVVYDTTNNQLEAVINGAWTVIGVAGAGDNTLDESYDQGGAGLGRTITVDSGDVQLNLAADDALQLNVQNGITAADGILLTATGTGIMTDAIDASHANIVNALNVGANVITGTTGNITYTNFTVTGSTGALTCESIDRVSAGGFTIGGTTATSVTITPNATFSGTTLHTGAATFSAGITQTGGNVSYTASATTGDGFLIDGSTVTTGNALRVEYDATASGAGFGAVSVTEDGVEVFVVAEDGNTTIAGTNATTNALTITAGTVSHGGHYDLTGAAASSTDLIDVIRANDATGGDAFDIDMGNAAVAGDALDIAFGTGAATGAGVRIAFGGASTGDGVVIDMTNAVGANAIDLTGAGARTVPMITITDTPGAAAAACLDINATPTAAASLIDVDIAGTSACIGLAINFSAASTGDAINVDMTNAVGANAIQLTGAGTRTVPLVTITDVPTTSAPTIDLNITPGAAVQAGIDIDVAGTTGADIIAVDFSAAHTGDAVNITMDNAGAAASALVIDGNVAHSGNVVDISSSGAFAGGTGRLATLTTSGQPATATSGLTLNVVDSGAAQATTYAFRVASTNNEAAHFDTGLVVIDESFSALGAVSTITAGPNFVQAAGAANAITATLNNVVGVAVVLTDGLRVIIDLNSRTLQAGANTLDLNGGGAVSIVSHYNPANNIGTAYAANGIVELIYNSTSAVWMDVSQ